MSFSSFPPTRPWRDFLDITKIAFPHPSKLQDRILTNFSYFAGNYLTTFICCFIFSCLINPLLLFAVIISTIGGLTLRNYLQGPSLSSLKTTEQSKNTRHFSDSTSHLLAQWYMYGVIMFLVLMGNIPLFFMLFCFYGGMLTHAALREKSLKGKATRVWDLYLSFNPLPKLIRFIEGIDTSTSNTSTSQEKDINKSS